MSLPHYQLTHSHSLIRVLVAPLQQGEWSSRDKVRAMRRHILNRNIFTVILVAILSAGLGVVLAVPANAQGPSVPAEGAISPQRAVLDTYCVSCHNESLATAGLRLDTIPVEHVSDDPVVWEKVAKKLRTGAMPPPGMLRPTAPDYDSLATYLETELDGAAIADPNPGRPVLHRLNRVEYSNAVRDFLGVDIDAVDIKSLLPPDETSQGFDNIGAALSVSPLLMERYLLAAGKIARIAVGDATIRPVFETYGLPKFLMQDTDRMSEDLPFGSRGGTALRHYFPVEGDYVIQVRLQRMARESIRGLLNGPHDMEVRLDGERVEVFTVGGENPGAFVYFGAGRAMEPAQEEYERTADQDLTSRVHVTAGTHVVGVTFPKKAALTEGALMAPLTIIEFSQFKGGPPAVGEVIIGGPYDATGVGDTPSRSKIFVCRPTSGRDEEVCARKIVSALARRAYRRPVTEEDLSILLGFYWENRSEGSFEDGIRAALERILLDPEFLFRFERDPANIAADTAYRISDLELASRLSFFLWSSIPDDELLNLAEQDRLNQPAVLEQQVQRMLADPRSKAFVTNFPGQWLLLRNLPSYTPDPEVFPYFDDNLREALQRETELFFESLVREDRPVHDLLGADYTFVNERLAAHYGIPDVYGSRFRRVTLTDENRRGLLGHASILTATSYANRTAPTLRGKWILDNILGAPPPAAPPDIPELKENTSGDKVLTMRERMEEHRANPSCASCHNQMDPLGFALENFDGIGGWRINDGGSKIDPSGVLPDGEKFESAAELRQVLLGKSEQFVGTVTERLLTYALGRGLEYYDAPAVRNIMREGARDDYRWSSIIASIVRSVPFQMRRSQP